MRIVIEKIYERKAWIKWGLVLISMVGGVASLLYTNQLVQELKEREVRQIALYAKAQEAVARLESSEDLNFLFTEIVEHNTSIPVIWTDANKAPKGFRNLELPPGLTDVQKKEYLLRQIRNMQDANDPIAVELGEGWTDYIYYENSHLLRQLRYYPYIQFGVIIMLAWVGYVIFSSFRRAEENQVWVGLAKETAHQLGTPISSLSAWMEYLRAEGAIDEATEEEMAKDILRLEMITARFSSIGSIPQLKQENVLAAVEEVIAYLSKRISTKVTIRIIPRIGEDLRAPLNIPLFEWVIENLCKNAVDAMNGAGRIDIYLRVSRDHRTVVIDVRDTGKGIPPGKQNAIFRPGFTTKKRGWGLGLALAKRIVEQYHRGRIFVRRSKPSVGTTFRIILPKE